MVVRQHLSNMDSSLGIKARPNDANNMDPFRSVEAKTKRGIQQGFLTKNSDQFVHISIDSCLRVESK